MQYPLSWCNHLRTPQLLQKCLRVVKWTKNGIQCCSERKLTILDTKIFKIGAVSSKWTWPPTSSDLATLLSWSSKSGNPVSLTILRMVSLDPPWKIIQKRFKLTFSNYDIMPIFRFVLTISWEKIILTLNFWFGNTVQCHILLFENSQWREISLQKETFSRF